MTKYKNQHTVTKGYLRGFCKTGQVTFYQYMRNAKRVVPCNISNATTQKYFYDFDLADKKFDVRILGPELASRRRNHLELNAFKDYEENIGSISNLLLAKTKYINRTIAEILCKGYLMQKTRTVAFRNLLNEPDFKKAVSNDVRNKFIRDFSSSFPDAEITTIKHFIDRGISMYSETDGLNHQLSLLNHFINGSLEINQLVNTLLCYRIDVMNAPVEHYFLTSDDPGFTIMTNDKVVSLTLNNVGQIIFPINSRQAIQFYDPQPLGYIHDLKRISYQDIDEKLVNQINRQTFHLATDFVFCENEEYLQTLVNNMHH